MKSGSFALLKSGDNQVENIIVADEVFSLEGYALVHFAEDCPCQIGMFYNEEDEKFYDDELFTKIGGVSVESD